MSSAAVQHEVYPFHPQDEDWIYTKLPVEIAISNEPVTIAYIKMAFNEEAINDREQTAFKIQVVFNHSNGPDEGLGRLNKFKGAFEGFVIGDLAVAQSSLWGHDAVINTPDKERKAVQTWLQDAQDALVCNVHEVTKLYKHFLLEDGGVSLPERRKMLLFTWKIKLQPFGYMPLGTVRLRGVLENENVSKMCDWIISPLLYRLHTERTSRLKFEKNANDRERNLLSDNHKLLKELRMLSDQQKTAENQQIARFMKLLNTKKQQITKLQEEVAKLKKGPTKSIIIDQKEVTDRRRPGSSDNQYKTISKIRRCSTIVKDFSSKDENSALGNIDTEHKLPELEKIIEFKDDNIPGSCEYIVVSPEKSDDNIPGSYEYIVVSPEKSDDNISGSCDYIVVSPEKSDDSMSAMPPISSAVPVSSAAMDVPVDPRYLADTQIDSPYSSPRSLQQPMEVLLPQVQPSSDQHDEHQPMEVSLSQVQPSSDEHDEHQSPTNNSVLDDLWSGIL